VRKPLSFLYSLPPLYAARPVKTVRCETINTLLFEVARALQYTVFTRHNNTARVMALNRTFRLPFRGLLQAMEVSSAELTPELYQDKAAVLL
jgi:hypothetical protein